MLYNIRRKDVASYVGFNVMAIGLFGGSFDPVHSQHVRYAEEAIRALGLNKLYILPSYVAPHKQTGAHADASARLAMCRLAFAHLPQVEVSDYEIVSGGTSYSYLTCKHFRALYPSERIYFFVGADMLENFFTWKNPDELLSYCTLVACGRGNAGTEELKERFFARFSQDFIALDFTGEEVSSTRIRTDIAFGKPTGLPLPVEEYIRGAGLYAYPVIFEALALEKPSRREHTYRVAVMATARARSLKIVEEKVLLAAALHDCGKYLSPSSPLLAGFQPPENTPEPVLHQFTGAYLAEAQFGVTDGEILNAVRYHTSGREGMSDLEKLVFLADTLEEGRDFPEVERLRVLFWEDLDACLLATLAHQLDYLKESGKPVYPLTQRAYEYLKENKE